MKKDAVGIINACSNLVAQLDAHPAGASIFAVCFAMLLLVVVVVHLTNHHDASRGEKSS